MTKQNNHQIPKKSLTDKQLRFVKEYMIDLNAAAAARRAGYSVKTADRIGYQNLRKLEIAREIEKEMVDQQKRTQITADKVIREISCIAFSNIKDYLTWDNEKLTVFPTEKLSREQAAALASIKQIESKKRRRVEVKLHDKLSALSALGRHLGMFKGKGEDVEAQPEVNLAESMKILMQHGFKPPNPAARIPGIDDDLDN